MSNIDVVDRPAARNGMPGAAPDRGRVVHRRSAPPGGRAVVGGFLVAAAAVGLFLTAARSTQRHGASFVVAKRDLPAGERIDSADLALVTIDLPPTSAGRAFRSIGQLVGASTSAPLGKGELVQAGVVVPAGKAPGFREVTIPVDAVQSQAVVPGDAVDVLVTTGNAESARTDVVVSGARVLRVGGRSGSLSNDKPSVTFAVSDFPAVSRMVQAAHAGSLTLVRANGFAAQPPTFSATARATP